VVFGGRLAIIVHSLRQARYKIVLTKVLLEPSVKGFGNGKRVVVEHCA
jgi:hypothetical protein